MTERNDRASVSPSPFLRRRLAVGLGDPALERAILPELQETTDFVIERCLTAGQLLAHIRGRRVEGLLVASDLPQLSDTALAELRRVQMPLVLLVPDPSATRWAGQWMVLPRDAAPDQVRAALDAALRGEQSAPPLAEPAPALVGAAIDMPRTEAGAALAVLAVASGAGSPGRTTVALGLAAALGAVAPTVLVDADLAGPSLAAHLDADPTRNLFMLAHGDPRTADDWDRALAQELQPLGSRSPHGHVLCGVPKLAMRAGISPRFFEHAVAELRARYRYVIVDIGADLLGNEVALHRAALGLAEQVLLIASADLPSLARVRTALETCRTQLGLDQARLALVINRHDRGWHHGQNEIEWALGIPLAALVPYDHRGVERALAAQRPLTLDRRSRAGRALLDLAERIHADRILLPPEPDTTRYRWRRAPSTDQAGSREPGPAPRDSHRRWLWPWRPRAAASQPAQPPVTAPTTARNKQGMHDRSHAAGDRAHGRGGRSRRRAR